MTSQIYALEEYCHTYSNVNISYMTNSVPHRTYKNKPAAYSELSSKYTMY